MEGEEGSTGGRRGEHLKKKREALEGEEGSTGGRIGHWRERRGALEE